MRKKIRMFSFIAVCMLLTSLSAPIAAVAVETDIVRIRYDSVSETDDGYFIFSFTETSNSLAKELEQEIKTSVLVVPTNEEYYNDLKSKIEKDKIVRASASYYETTVDSSQSYTIFMTVNFDKTTVDGKIYVRVSSITGGFTGGSGSSGNYVGSGVYIESQTLEVVTAGNPLNHPTDERFLNQMDTETFANTASSWSYAAPSGWYQVYQYSMPYARVQANLNVVARRGTSGTGSLCTASLSISYPTNV